MTIAELLEGLSIRDHLVARITKGLPEPHASLFAGIVLGDRRTISYEFRTLLIRSGTIHITAASGFNVSFVVNCVLAFRFLIFHQISRLILSLAAIWAYSLLAGLNPPVLRAAICGGLAVGAKYCGRVYSPWYGLGLTAIGMFTVIGLSNVSLWLSVTSTAGVFLSSRLIHGLSNQIETYKIQQSWQMNSVSATYLLGEFITSIYAFLLTLPVLLIVFGEASWIGIVANVLIAWVIPPLMVLGLIMVIAYQVSGFVLSITGNVSYLLLEYLVYIITFFGSFEFGYISLE